MVSRFSTSIFLNLLYTLIIIAMATAASAAATATINNVKKCPISLSGNKYRLKATNMMFTEFRINSTDISMVIRFFLVRNPKIPIKNIMVASTKKYSSGIP
jgi:hypothetical protein